MPDPSAYAQRHCREADNAVFFPIAASHHGDEGYADARRLCSGCPWAAPCLEAAMEAEGGLASESRFGMYGGHAPEERAALARRRARARRASA